MKSYKTGALILVAIALVFSGLAVARQNSTDTAATKIYVANGTEATITGVINFEGEVPRPRTIDTSADPDCETKGGLKTEGWVVKAGKVANTMIYIKGGGPLDEYTFPQPDSIARLAHQGCRYEPHALGIRTGQTLMIDNQDVTVHNSHATPRNNPEWNQSHASGVPVSISFSQPEPLLRFKDNQHPWEGAWVGVFSHPFFAVSDKLGSYTIKGLPPGRYTLAIAHERYGEKSVEVTVAAYETKSVDFTLNYADSLIKTPY